MTLFAKIDQEMEVEFAFFLRNSINYKIRHDLIPPELECVCIEIIKPHSRPFLVSTVYGPPSAPPEFFDNLEKLVKAIDDENKEMYILGDLNCDMLRKDNEINTATMTVKSLYEQYQLYQLIDQATRITMTTSSLIDLIVTSTPEKILDSGVIHTGISDHSLIFAIRKISIMNKPENTIEITNMKNFNEHNFIKELQELHWEYMYFFATDPNCMWEIWKTLFLEVVNKHAPIQNKIGQKMFLGLRGE